MQSVQRSRLSSRHRCWQRRRTAGCAIVEQLIAQLKAGRRRTCRPSASGLQVTGCLWPRCLRPHPRGRRSGTAHHDVARGAGRRPKASAWAHGRSARRRRPGSGPRSRAQQSGHRGLVDPSQAGPSTQDSVHAACGHTTGGQAWMYTTSRVGTVASGRRGAPSPAGSTGGCGLASRAPVGRLLRQQPADAAGSGPVDLQVTHRPASAATGLRLRLPETTERPGHGEPTWFVRHKRVFVSYAHQHHDDRVAFCARRRQDRWLPPGPVLPPALRWRAGLGRRVAGRGRRLVGDRGIVCEACLQVSSGWRPSWTAPDALRRDVGVRGARRGAGHSVTGRGVVSSAGGKGQRTVALPPVRQAGEHPGRRAGRWRGHRGLRCVGGRQWPGFF